MQTKQSFVAISFLATVQLATSQALRVDLPEKTVLANVGFHTTLFRTKPKELLWLPNIDTTGAMFFELYCQGFWDDDKEIAFMVFNRDSGDLIFADRNNDEDLTNDGPPTSLPNGQSEFTFDIHPTLDSLQVVTLSVRRKPVVPDSLVEKFVTQTGDMNPKMVRFIDAIAQSGNADPTAISTTLGGRRGTFYFDDRITIRQGIFSHDKKQTLIGLFDWTTNGLYNDEKDQLLVDLNGDGAFDYDGGEAFRLDDVFSMKAIRYEIDSLDKYGRWVALKQTEKQETNYLLREREEQSAANKRIPSRGDSKKLGDESIWNLSLKTIDGKPVRLSDLRGRFVLLNFWGEWCKPCVKEIPELVESYRSFSRTKLEFISFLKTSNLAKARQLIKQKEIEWQQIILPEKLENEMDIHAYPTNILLLPNGKSYIRVTGAANKAFFDEHVK